MQRRRLLGTTRASISESEYSMSDSESECDMTNEEFEVFSGKFYRLKVFPN